MIVKNLKEKIVFTFDDGPTEFLDGILEILEKEQISAVFFLQSDLINRQEDIQKLMKKGHLIGSHSHSHPNFQECAKEDQRNEIETSLQILQAYGKSEIDWFRPPYGLYNEWTHEIIKSLGLRMVLWNIASWDWKHERDPEMIIQNVLNYVEKDDIILLHELPQTVCALPKLINGIRKKGFQIARSSKEIELQV